MQQSAISKKSIIKVPIDQPFSIVKTGKTAGYDGHCLRAYSYFKERMPDIDPSSVNSINSIKSRYKEARQESKAPTFALT